MFVLIYKIHIFFWAGYTMSMQEKLDIFISITQKLHSSGIMPVLFGSLGVAVLINKDIPIHDIDILVPDVWVKDAWPALVALMSDIGFKVHDISEHEFIKNNQQVAFAGTSVLGDVLLALQDLLQWETNGQHYYLPTARQFLAIYTYSRNDGYRLEKRNDEEKIRLLTEYEEGRGE